MKVCTFLLTVAVATASQGFFAPPSITYTDLVHGRANSQLEAALTSAGMVAVSGIPSFAALRKDVLASTPACARASRTAVEHTYSDGTTRRTLATHTSPGDGGARPVAHGAPEGACADFDRASAPFRAVVSTATDLFAKQLSALLHLKAPLLFTEGGQEFASFRSVAEHGEHLEHFHTYTRPTTAATADLTAPTIELHTDQGIFIAFTPALMVRGGSHSDSSADLSRFVVGLADGSHAEARFDPDTLVFMLGDGLHQVLPTDRVEKHSPRLRAMPHALTAPPTARGESRTWYGRMVLPPNDAVIPATQSESRKTFGHLRTMMMDATLHSGDAEVMALGCSGRGMHATHREISACEAGTIYCWHRCMNITEHDGVYYGVSEEVCTAQDKALQCTDILGRIYNQTYAMHGDYFPACAPKNASYVDSGLPTLPHYPRSEATCDQAAWEAYSDTAGFDHWTDLGSSGKLMWSVVDGKVKSKMAYNGLFGFLAWGLRNNTPDAHHNGMNGAWIAMALPGGDFTNEGGLDLNVPGSVKPYRIHETWTSFRFWEGSGQAASAPNQARNGEAIPTVADTLEATAMDKTNCFSSMSFTAAALGEGALNVDGTDLIIWAANVEDAYIGYHGRGNRGILEVEWKVGARPFDDQNSGGGDKATDGSVSLGVGGISGSVALSIAVFGLGA